MIPAQELSLDPIPLFDAALWKLPDVKSQSICVPTLWIIVHIRIWTSSKVLAHL